MKKILLALCLLLCPNLAHAQTFASIGPAGPGAGSPGTITGTTITATGNIIAPAGSLASAALQYSGNAGTGIYFPNATEMDLLSNGGAAAKIFSNGQAAITGGSNTLTLSSSTYATCSGLTTASNVVGCTVSSLRLKNPLGVMPTADLDKLKSLRAVVYSYKDQVVHGARPGEFIGIYAEQVCTIDERLCIRDSEGRVTDYDERGLIAMLIEASNKVNACQASWRCRLFGW